MPLLRPALRGRFVLVCAVVLSGALTLARADQFNYEPPTNYYAAATGTGAALKTQLYTIISTGFVSRDYGASRYADAILDADPNAPGKIILIYNRASVSSTWDSGATWNREHIWPASLLGNSGPGNTESGTISDLFELRPCNPTINSTRSNTPYGTWTVNTTSYGNTTGGLYNPGPADRGDVARTIFYMATRYGQGQAHNLSIVNGSSPATYQMGDLESLLHWHYDDLPDTFERRRNEAIYNPALNPTYYQGNRNPYIDHPEYVWAVFGTSANTSKLTVNADGNVLNPADGASSVTRDLGKVIAGSSFGTATFQLNKAGNTPTTYDITSTGSVASTAIGTRQAFGFEPTSRTITANLTGGTTTIGVKSGTITINNTDLTGTSGQGVADGNDTVTVTGTVVSHAGPSFSLALSQLTQTIDLGIVPQDTASSYAGTFGIANRATSAFTANLDLDTINFTGDTAAFVADLPAAGTQVLANTANTVNVSFANGAALGTHSGTITITTSDENIPGATTLSSLTITLTGQVALAGDATLDGAVNFDDLLALAQNYDAPDAVWQTGDFNRSGTTDFDDLLSLAQQYEGTTAAFIDGATANFAADWALARSLVPEPASLSLLGVVLVGLRRLRA